MRDVRRLPLFLRIVRIVGMLFPLTALVMALVMFVAFFMGGVVARQELANDPRLLVIALNLTLLGLAYGFAVHRYRRRMRQPNQERFPLDAFPLDAWPGQARAIALLAALPLCAIVLAAISSPTQDAAVLTTFLISIIGAVVLITAYARLVARG